MFTSDDYKAVTRSNVLLESTAYQIDELAPSPRQQISDIQAMRQRSQQRQMAQGGSVAAAKPTPAAPASVAKSAAPRQQISDIQAMRMRSQQRQGLTAGYEPDGDLVDEGKTPVSRDAGNFRYSGRTGEEKAERRAKVLGDSPDPKKRRQANTIRSRIKAVADRDKAQAGSEAREKLYRGQQRRANQLAKELMSKEEFETVVEYLFVEGYTDTIESAERMAEHISEKWIQDIVEAPGEWFGGLRDKMRSARNANMQRATQSLQQKPLPSTTSPFAKPASRNDSGRLTTYGAGGGSAAERAGQNRTQVMRQGATNLEKKPRPQANPGPNFGR